MRPLLALPAVADAAFAAALTAALDGTGPAVLPVPTDPAEAARVRAALRPDEPEPDEEALEAEQHAEPEEENDDAEPE